MSATQYGGKLKARREALGMTVSFTAKLVGVSPSYISNVESGREIPSYPFLARLIMAMESSALTK